jgi:succinate dehydrogenase hydrophobic anchor subunit
VPKIGIQIQGVKVSAQWRGLPRLFVMTSLIPNLLEGFRVGSEGVLFARISDIYSASVSFFSLALIAKTKRSKTYEIVMKAFATQSHEIFDLTYNYFFHVIKGLKPHFKVVRCHSISFMVFYTFLMLQMYTHLEIG